MTGDQKSLAFRVMALANLALTLALLAHFVLLPEQRLFQAPTSAVSSDFPTISIGDASKLIDDPNTVIVDARAAKVYVYGHVPKAVSLPLNSALSSDLLTPLRAATTIVVYCDGPHCDASHELALKLRAEGLAEILLMRDGWQGWLAAGLPIETQPD